MTRIKPSKLVKQVKRDLASKGGKVDMDKIKKALQRRLNAKG